MAKLKVRPDSRAGLMVKAMLDRCEVPRMPSLNTHSRFFDGEDHVSLNQFIRRGMGVVDAGWLIHTADAIWEMDARDHDAPELETYLHVIGKWEDWLGHTIYSNSAVVLFSPSEARGRWMLATDGLHDFPAECPASWRLADGTYAGEPPPGKPL